MRRLRVTLAVGGLALGIAAELVTYRSGDLTGTAVDLAVGWVLTGCGLVAWERRGQSRVGPLMVAAGGAWFLGSFATAALYVHRGPLVHALLSYPSGRVSGWRGRAIVIAVYVDGLVEPLGRNSEVTLALCVAIVASAAHGYADDGGPRRRARAASLAGATAVAGVLGFGALGRLAGWGTDAATLLAYEVVLLAVAMGLLADLVRARWSQGALTGLVVDLGGVWEPVTLRDRLAGALGDNSLQVGYWLDGERGYVDDAGRAFMPPTPGGERVVTSVGSAGEPVAVLVHDRAVLDDPELVEAVSAAARIAVANVRLQAQVRVRVEQLAASRRRIIEAAAVQRRALERELHEGAARRLDRVSQQLECVDVDEPRARELLGDARHHVGAARSELGELARGIHPAALTNGGLTAALPELAERAPIPVDLDVGARRYHPAVEAAVYFACSEALTNVAKHAHASRVGIDVHHSDGHVVVVIADDGVGGADPRGGSGLRGLSDRVEALGGRLSVQSRRGRGTRLVVEIPTR